LPGRAVATRKTGYQSTTREFEDRESVGVEGATLEGRPFRLPFVGRSTFSPVAAMTELRLRDATFCFDGRVLEVSGMAARVQPAIALRC
jgi:hypothetical protein